MNHKKTPLHFHPLHIFRAILRETTYHPDPEARLYLKHHTRDAFRINKIKFAIHRQSWDPAYRRKREVALMRRARHFCYALQRANEGYLEPFRRTLSLTYARTGARRRQLMAQIMAPFRDSESHSAATETAAAQDDNSDGARLPASPIHTGISFPTRAKGRSVLFPMEPSPSGFFPPAEESASSGPPAESTEAEAIHEPSRARPPKKAPPLFTALSTSQSSASSYIPSQTRTNRSRPKLPTTTIWQRPLPASRIRNLTAKWYAKEASILLPPLPLPEWTHIRSIAAGSSPLTPRPRRAAATTQVFSPAPAPAELASSLLALPQREAGYEGKKRGNPHCLTARFVRRQYEWLLRHVPLQIDAPKASSAPAPAATATAEAAAAGVVARPPDGAEQPQADAGAEARNEVEQTKQQRNKADNNNKKPTFLWHSSVVDRGGRRMMQVQSVSARATKALFD